MIPDATLDVCRTKPWTAKATDEQTASAANREPWPKKKKKKTVELARSPQSLNSEALGPRDDLAHNPHLKEGDQSM